MWIKLQKMSTHYFRNATFMVEWKISKFRISLLVVSDRRRLSMLMKLIGIIVSSICLATHIMSCRRDNGTVRDLDALVKSTSKATAKAYQQKISGIVGDKLVISTFKLSPYEENVHGRFDFSGDRYVDSEGHLYWRLGGIETEIPVESLEQWLVKRGDETICAVPNPVAQLGAYGCRSITGWRPKDREKVGKLVKIITPNRKISDIPAEYRGQYRAFREQYKKVAAARKKLGFFGVRADFLSLVENQPQFVEFAQGPLEGVLSRAVRRV